MLSFFPRDVLDEILDLIESVSGVVGGVVPAYSFCIIFIYLPAYSGRWSLIARYWTPVLSSQ